ncbi:unnamed protein product [Effrenium voratum]|uniref:Uncharacterized protein n=1 Tax=Effrenium voratum TaxID=2562239 RepID=A0AA36NED2_9DINO|nr:unnamed protein product [Effrenium voratum]
MAGRALSGRWRWRLMQPCLRVQARAAAPAPAAPAPPGGPGPSQTSQVPQILAVGPRSEEEMKQVIEHYERSNANQRQSPAWRIFNSSMGAVLAGLLGGGIMYLAYCADDVSSTLSDVWALLFRQLSPETVQRLLLRLAKWRLLPRDFDKDDPYLIVEPHEGLRFYTPVGLAPGLDRHGEGLGAFFDLGFGFVEVGPASAAEAGRLEENLQRRDLSQQIAAFGLLGICITGTREELLAQVTRLGPYAQYLSVDFAEVAEVEAAKLLRELTLAAAQLPGRPRIFLRLPSSWSASASHEVHRVCAAETGKERLLRVGALARALRSAEAAGLIVCHDDEAGDCGGTKETRRRHRELISEAYAEAKAGGNDFGRNEFYRAALAAAKPRGRVLDLGAGSGLLAMLAALESRGDVEVWALEANPALAELAVKTIDRNRHLFPDANLTVVPELSSRVSLAPADLIVTETFGTMLLGEGVLNWISDARDRLLKPGGAIIPAGGCQYLTLVELASSGVSSPWHPKVWRNLDLSPWERLQDTLYWKAMSGASREKPRALSERICLLEVDLYTMTAEDVPKSKILRIKAQKAGIIHAALFDWDIWADPQRTQVLSTSPGSRNFAGDVAWGWLLQLQEAAAEDWRLGAERPAPLRVEAGQWLEVLVEFIAHGISAHVRVRPELAGKTSADDSAPGSPERMHGIGRAAAKEANEFLLPVAGDHERHDFYAKALEEAKESLSSQGTARLLDCSALGLPGLAAARDGLRAVLMPRWDHLAAVLKEMLEAQGINGTEVLTADPREMFDILMPEGEKADIVVLEPPGTPLHGLSPFALLPQIRKELLKADGLVVPGSACLELGLVESEELSYMFSIPRGHWQEVDLTVWNEEARRQGVLTQLVPYTKWLGSHSSLRYRWLSPPECIYHVDLNAYGTGPMTKEETFVRELRVVEDGQVHAIVARWAVFSSSQRLGADSSYLGRDLTWPHYVQAVAKPNTQPGLLEPLPLRKGGVAALRVSVRQGAAKVTGTAGPEFTLRLAEGGESRTEL